MSKMKTWLGNKIIRAKKSVRELHEDVKGGGLVEYIVIVGVIVVAAIVIFNLIKPALENRADNIVDALEGK